MKKTYVLRHGFASQDGPYFTGMSSDGADTHYSSSRRDAVRFSTWAEAKLIAGTLLEELRVVCIRTHPRSTSAPSGGK